MPADPDDPEDFDVSVEALDRAQRAQLIRRTRTRLALSQAEFAARFHVPVGTLRDWEQARATAPDFAVAYVRVIARHPDMVAQAVAWGTAPSTRGSPMPENERLTGPASGPDAPEATDEQIAQRQPFTEADPDLAEAMWRKQVADEDDAPDLSTPYWQERFAKVKVRRGRREDGSGDT